MSNHYTVYLKLKRKKKTEPSNWMSKSSRRRKRHMCRSADCGRWCSSAGSDWSGFDSGRDSFQACHPCSCVGPPTRRVLHLSLKLCSFHLEILNNFWTGVLHFHFTLDPRNYVAGLGSDTNYMCHCAYFLTCRVGNSKITLIVG